MIEILTTNTKEYKSWLKELKLKVRQAQTKAAVKVNTTLLEFYLDDRKTRQQVVAQLVTPQLFQIPWGHNIVIISKCKTIKKALFYVHKTIVNGWRICLE